MKQRVIIGSGQYNYDIIKLREYLEGFVIGKRNPYSDRVLTEEVGGTCGNVMCMLAHLGWDARPQVKLKNSEEGQRLADSLKEYGCDMRHVALVEGGGFSGLECVHKRHKTTGEKQIAFRSYGPDGSRFRKITELRIKDEVPALLESLTETPDVYFFDHSEAGPRMIAEVLGRRGALVYYECENCKDWHRFEKCIAVAHIIKFSNENVPDTSFCDAYPDKLFIQTLGAQGLRYRLPQGEWQTISAVEVDEVIDWEGCGDTTTAVFLNELGKIGLPKISELTDSQVRAALEAATAKAAFCTRFYGSKGWIHAEKGDGSFQK